MCLFYLILRSTTQKFLTIEGLPQDRIQINLIDRSIYNIQNTEAILNLNLSIISNKNKNIYIIKWKMIRRGKYQLKCAFGKSRVVFASWRMKLIASFTFRFAAISKTIVHITIVFEFLFKSV